MLDTAKGAKVLMGKLSQGFNVPLDGVTSADGDLGRDENELSGIGSHLDVLGFSTVGRSTDGGNRNTSGKTGSTGHGGTAGAVVVRGNYGVEVVVEFVPVKRSSKLSLHVVLKGSSQWVDSLDTNAGSASVSGGALSSRKKRE